MVEGLMPLALPGGQAMAARPALAPMRPLELRTPAKEQTAFSIPRKTGTLIPAFWRHTKKAFKGK